MKKSFFLLFTFFVISLFANPTFPELTGRVVDNAQILSNDEENKLTNILKKHEDESYNQIVIVTLNSLEGYDITDYGYQLGRHWGIGQKDKNNGVLLIISMSEKKIRIEVGYGLEGSLPDKISHEIIEYILKPKFRQGSFYNGISESTNAIIKAIKGEYKPSEHRVLDSSSENWFFVYFVIIFLSGLIGGIIRKYKNNTISKLFHASMLGGFGGTFAIAFFNSFLISIIAFAIISIIIFLTTKKISFSDSNSSSLKASSHSGGFGGGYSSGGGFSGGGGSFGGGGASGGW